MRVVDYQRERLRAINASELISRDVLLLDGGLATEVEKYNGVNLSEGSLWSARLLLPQNAHLQQAIVNAHVQYYSSGADIVTTASYQASLDGLLREFQGDSKRAEKAIIKMLMKSVELAGIARDSSWKGKDRTSSPKPLIAASIGCYGAALADGSVRLILNFVIDLNFDVGIPRRIQVGCGRVDGVAFKSISHIVESFTSRYIDL